MPLYCPFCNKEIAHNLPYPASKAAVRQHIVKDHPDKKGKVKLDV